MLVWLVHWLARPPSPWRETSCKTSCGSPDPPCFISFIMSYLFFTASQEAMAWCQFIGHCLPAHPHKPPRQCILFAYTYHHCWEGSQWLQLHSNDNLTYSWCCRVCTSCGHILDHSAWSSEPTFTKEGGESTVAGHFVSDVAGTHGLGRISNGRIYGFQVPLFHMSTLPILHHRCCIASYMAMW